MPRLEPGQGLRMPSMSGRGTSAWKWSLVTAVVIAGSAAGSFKLLVELFRTLC